ncbi:MAG TPA: flavin-dependent oxidoreductase, partial [Acidimicrobiaceae bacterium]|nr:flavin-dependent oxidoreductase [Acidimicrobiaceae bacterium]
GVFDEIDDVISRDEIESFMACYMAATGFAVEALNAAPRTLPEGATLTPRPGVRRG